MSIASKIRESFSDISILSLDLDVDEEEEVPAVTEAEAPAPAEETASTSLMGEIDRLVVRGTCLDRCLRSFDFYLTAMNTFIHFCHRH
jgi:hypothetical protein